ncbi:MAG: hypothetical protein JOZ40_00780, partial [Methylobacteriaceae bacterium]|nr:hypothetical protein [Methylobacteriaceae bacterium]
MNIIGYSDRISVRAGETIRFMVSCERPVSYRADLVRVVCGDLNPAGPGYREVEIDSPINGQYEGRRQPLLCGSYAIVEGARLAEVRSLCVQAMVWPTRPRGKEQVLLSHWSGEQAAGYELVIDVSGAVALRLGDGSGRVELVSTELPIREREWCLVGASVDAATKRVVLHQQ